MLTKNRFKDVTKYGLRVPEESTGAPADALSDLYIEIAEWKVGKPVTLHFQHDTFLYFYSGNCKIIVDQEEYHIHEGDAVILRGGQSWHYFLSDEHLCSLMSVNFKGTLTDEMLRTYGLSHGGHFPRSGCGPMCDMLEKSCSRDSADCVELQDEILRFLLYNFQHLSQNKAGNVSIIAGTIKKLLLRDLYSPELHIASIAQELHCSPQKLQSYFQAAYHTSIRRFIIEKRLDRARELLLSTEMSLSDIATAVGYANRNYLDRLFVQNLGLSAAAYRRAAREGHI